MCVTLSRWNLPGPTSTSPRRTSGPTALGRVFARAGHHPAPPSGRGMGRRDSGSVRRCAARADRAEPVVQPALVVPIGFVVLLVGRRGEGPARDSCGAGVHRPVSRGVRAPRGRPGRPARLGGLAALPQPVPDDLHHPVRDQILADHPRLYWTRHCTPGRDWFRIQKPVPTDPLWTAKQDSISLPDGSACRAFGTRSAWPAGGTSASTRCGC